MKFFNCSLRKALCLLPVILLACFTFVRAETNKEEGSIPVPGISSVIGRLSLEQHGEDQWLVLHAKNSDTYLVTGKLQQDLKQTLAELGENNLFFLTGTLTGQSNVSCSQKNSFEYDNKGKKIKISDTVCIRYFIFDVFEVLSSRVSEEKIPDPKREIAEERRLIKQSAAELTPAAHGEFFGTITAVSIQSPIKVIELANADKDSPLKKISLVLSPDTRIALALPEKEPVGVGLKALKKGQQVTAVYTRTELKSTAQFITITSE